jgi:hypothetical protein
MDSLKINTGIKRILINDGPEFIEFNPSDVAFAERFQSLIADFRGKQAEYQARAAELDNQELDADGIPVNLTDGLALMREVCTYMRGRIDWLFGAGTSQKVFGDALVLDAFAQFFEGVTPFIQAARSEKAAQYSRPKQSGRVMK